MPRVFENQHLITDKSKNRDCPGYGACSNGNPDTEDHRNVPRHTHERCSTYHTEREPLTWAQKKLIVGMVLVSLLSGSLVAVMIPFFPVEAASRGVSQVTISGVFSCFAMMQMIMSPIIARVAPVIGVTRLYNIGIATAGVTTVMFGALYHIADTRAFVAACFIVRMLEAAGTAAVSGCAFTIIANKFPDRTSRLVALITAAQAIGMSVAPAVGSGLYALAGFSLPFYVTGGMMLAVTALNIWIMPPLERCERTSVPFLSMLKVFSESRENWLCLLTVFQYSLVFLTFDTCVAPYADRALGVTPDMLGLYFTAATAAYALTSGLWARVAESARRPHALISIGLLVVAASLLLIPPSPLLVGLTPHRWLLGVGMTLMEGSFGGAYIPCFQLMLAAAARHGLPDDLVTQAFVSGVLWTVHSLGCVVGPPIGGLIVDTYGFPVMMTCLSGLVVLVAMLNMGYAVSKACHRTRDETDGSSSEETSSESERLVA